MSRVLRINWLQVKVKDSREWQEKYVLKGNVVAVLGPIDRGKTSLTECIDYLLVRAVTFRGAVDKKMVSIRAEMRIGDSTYLLRRDRARSSTVSVQELDGTPVGRFPTKAATGDQPSLSDWLLAELGLDDVFASVRLPGGKGLTFAGDLLPYLHIRQEDIDRFVIRPAYEGSARLAVLSLLLDLSNPELERLTAEITDLANSVRSQQNKAREIAEFLAASEATNADALDAEITDLCSRYEDAVARHRRLREDARSATAFARDMQDQVEQARKRAGQAQDGVDWAARRRHSATAKVEALTESLTHLAETEVLGAEARHGLALLYSACPTCETDLTGRTVPTAHCSLCTSPLPEVARAKEKTRLEQALEVAAQDLAQTERDLDSARQAAQSAQNHLEQQARKLDEQTADAVTPYVDAIAAAAADVEAGRSKLAVLERLRSPHRRLADRQAEITEKQARLEEMRSRQHQLMTRIQDPRPVLDSLNALFRQIVRRFKLPWATGRARLDPKTFTPMVDEQDFDQRGGGSRTAVSVAYSLALLLYALENPSHCHLPTLLILDSPQKNFGRNAHDQDLANRMYEWIITYLDYQRQEVGGPFEHIQLIIVDNGIPGKTRAGFNRIITFGEDSGFLRDLDHPHGQPLTAEQLDLDNLNEDEAADELI